MLSDTARDALYDIRDHTIYATEFVAGMDLETFKLDRKTFFAATRALEIVSEAARRLPEDLRTRHPELPWRAIMGSGNIYRHNYDNVAHHAVWQTIHGELPALAAVVEEEIARLG
jgi:uncharacterized protein with HEPN domain